jgi:hypothetical protein
VNLNDPDEKACGALDAFLAQHGGVVTVVPASVRNGGFLMYGTTAGMLPASGMHLLALGSAGGGFFACGLVFFRRSYFARHRSGR